MGECSLAMISTSSDASSITPAALIKDLTRMRGFLSRNNCFVVDPDAVPQTRLSGSLNRTSPINYSTVDRFRARQPTVFRNRSHIGSSNHPSAACLPLVRWAHWGVRHPSRSCDHSSGLGCLRLVPSPSTAITRVSIRVGCTTGPTWPTFLVLTWAVRWPSLVK
jgi:hypothetical protein